MAKKGVKQFKVINVQFKGGIDYASFYEKYFKINNVVKRQCIDDCCYSATSIHGRDPGTIFPGEGHNLKWWFAPAVRKSCLQSQARRTNHAFSRPSSYCTEHMA